MLTPSPIDVTIRMLDWDYRMYSFVLEFVFLYIRLSSRAGESL